MKTLFKSIPRIAVVLSDGKFGFFLINLSKLFLFALLTKRIVNKFEISLILVVPGGKRPFFIKTFADLCGLIEVFSDEEYHWCPVLDPRVIIDIGAHIGDTALYYHRRFPNALIVAVEPAPETYRRLEKNVVGIKEIVPIQAAMGSTDGTVEFFINENSLGSSVVARSGPTNPVVVQQMTLSSLYERVGITKADLVKFDIEGSEFSMFKSQHVDRFARAYIGEVHADLASDTKEVAQLLESFTNAGFVPQHSSGEKRFILKAE